MSTSLLKHSISIVEEDLSFRKKKKRSQGKESNHSIFDLIPEKQKLYGKYKNSRGDDVRYEKLQHVKKFTIEEAKKISNEKKKKTSENLDKLLRLGSNRLTPKVKEKLLKRVEKRLKRDNNDEDKPKKEVSIFTEDDFKAFEKEYFNN